MRLARYICPDILARMRPAITDDREAQKLLDWMLVAFIAACLLPGIHAWLIAWGWL